ncbi:MAG TPA: hypothetical protein VII01_11555 [Solirubrobacteraceae bacterium]|jgi:hypothetical protein
MGLLDDAIREHLELKRRSGADPGAIAQAEHEALDPIFPEEPAVAEDGAMLDGASSELSAEQEPTADAYSQPADAGTVASDDQPAPAAEGEDFSNVGQETAELDMQAMLDEQPPMAPAATQPVRAGSARPSEPEEIEWHDGERAEQQPLPEEIPGQERLTFE